MRLKSKKQIRNEKILADYTTLVGAESAKMEVYKYLAKKYKLSIGGIRYAIHTAQLQNK